MVKRVKEELAFEPVATADSLTASDNHLINTFVLANPVHFVFSTIVSQS